MNLIGLLTYVFVFKNYKSKEMLGNDERFPLIQDKSLMPKVVENFQKKELLDYLSSENVTLINKINAINMYYGTNTVKPINLTNGGLLKDWDFEI